MLGVRHAEGALAEAGWCETRPSMQSARAGLEVLGPPPGKAAKDASFMRNIGPAEPRSGLTHARFLPATQRDNVSAP